MNLEVIERGRLSRGHPSVVLVHGYWQAAWTWADHVQPQLSYLGHHCLALSLRGHGKSEGRIRGSSIGDYIQDVASVVSRLETPPILVGHSMGGYVVQHYLERKLPASGAILVSPVPATGAWGATFRVARRHPGKFLKTNLTMDVGAVVENPEHAYEWLVASAFPESEFERYASRLERASYRVYMSMLMNRPKLAEVDIPALVVGGTRDGFFGVDEFEATAAALNARLVTLEGFGHQPNWEGQGVRLVEEIDRFVRSLGSADGE